ncbi:MAG: FixH family protein [Nannocystaceae bacterium]|nr:FixH family protein [Nannocystaceae bacterium]
MLRPLASPAALLTATLVASAGCPATDDGENADSSSSSGSGGGGGFSCADETRDDDYALGLSRTGEHVTVSFVDAMPAPPARGDNTWVLAISDPTTGMPIDDAMLSVEPYMPDHMHGTSIACNVTDGPQPGQVELAPVNLFMPGLWEVRLHFTLPEAVEETVVFKFCVDP